MTINIETNDRQSISNILSEYSSIQKEFESIEKQLTELETQKVSLLSRLDLTKELEISLFESFSERYGNGKLDIVNFKYITEK